MMRQRIRARLASMEPSPVAGRDARRQAIPLLLALCVAGCAVPVGNHPYSESDMLAAALAKGGVFLIDVRTAAEYGHGHIPGAVLIPHDEIEDHLDEIPRDMPIVVYCRSSHRVRRAIGILEKNGYEVYNFGRLGRWEGEIEKGP
jgi:rhodanese-related sulfurtransferase